MFIVNISNMQKIMQKNLDMLRIRLHKKNIFAMDFILPFVMELTCFVCHLQWNEHVCVNFCKLQC